MEVGLTALGGWQTKLERNRPERRRRIERGTFAASASKNTPFQGTRHIPSNSRDSQYRVLQQANITISTWTSSSRPPARSLHLHLHLSPVAHEVNVEDSRTGPWTPSTAPVTASLDTLTTIATPKANK